jgi:hypothetical protein
MASAYRPQVLIANNGTIISLKYVESISQVSKEGEDAVVNKLKGDVTFDVTTVSGARYTISISHIVKAYIKECSFDDDKNDVYLAILERWIHLLGTV